MKTLTLIMLVAAGLLSGCVAYSDPHDGRHHDGATRDRDHDGMPDRRDRDGDGVPNRYDSNPNNPSRY